MEGLSGRALPEDWAPAPAPFDLDYDPAATVDAVLWIVATVCGVCLGFAVDLLIAAVA